jgi:hypothetical protein
MRPHLRVYDVAAEPVASAYSRAIADGAGFVVGPLTKEDVAALAPLTAGRAPVLALNFLGESTIVARNFYQFALLPEDEARIVARKIVADGKLKRRRDPAGGRTRRSRRRRVHRRAVAPRRHAARQPALRIAARRFLRHHQANTADSRRQGRTRDASPGRRIRVHRR